MSGTGNASLDAKGSSGDSKAVRSKQDNKKENHTEKSGTSKSKQNEEKKTPRARCGEEVAISPALIAKVRKMERNSSSSVMASFCALSASADKLLPGKPVTLSKDAKSNTEAADKPSDPVKDKDPERSGEDSDSVEKKWVKEYEEENGWRREKDGDYFCELCGSQANSLLTYETHLQGRKHQRKLAAIHGSADRKAIPEQPRPEEGPPLRSVPKRGAIPKIQSKLDIIDFPVIGLDYISEIWKLDENEDLLYYCKLCESTCQPNTIISHIGGYRHRLCYLRQHLPTAYDNVKHMTVKKSELSKLLEKHARQLEELGGRGQMIVEVEIERTPSPKPFRKRLYETDDQQESIPYNRELISEAPIRHEVATDFKIENVRHYPSETRMAMLQELVSIDPEELKASVDVERLEFVIENFKQALADYRNRMNDSFGRSLRESGSAWGSSEDVRHDPDPYGYGRSLQASSYDNRSRRENSYNGGFRREELEGRNSRASFGSSVQEDTYSIGFWDPADAYDICPPKTPQGRAIRKPSLSSAISPSRESFVSSPHEAALDQSDKKEDESVRNYSESVHSTGRDSVVSSQRGSLGLRQDNSFGQSQKDSFERDSFGPSQRDLSGSSQRDSSGLSERESFGLSQRDSSGPSQRDSYSSGPSRRESYDPNQRDSSGPSQRESFGLSQRDSSGPSPRESFGLSQRESFGPSQRESFGLNQRDSSGTSQRNSFGLSQRDSSGPSPRESFGLSQRESFGLNQRDSSGPIHRESFGLRPRSLSGPSQRDSFGLSQRESFGLSQRDSSGPIHASVTQALKNLSSRPRHQDSRVNAFDSRMLLGPNAPLSARDAGFLLSENEAVERRSYRTTSLRSAPDDSSWGTYKSSFRHRVSPYDASMRNAYRN